MSDFFHVPVLLEEAVDGLLPRSDGVYLDCTLGGAGHSRRILERSAPGGRLVAIDQDRRAIAHAKRALADFQGRFRIVHANFRELKRIVEEYEPAGVDGILFDLGVSSPQLDEGERGFSYIHDAPLDMRMDRSQPFTAYELVNTWSEQQIADVIYRYGEERWGRRIAQYIVNARKKRPIATTGQLVDIIKAAIPAAARRQGPHPAKRTFQALRIAVNDELNALEQALQDAVDCLKAGGRVAVITFHSLEDRIAKHIMQAAVKGCICPPQLPACQCGRAPKLKLVTRKPILPSAEEVDRNPRARSAKLRIAERI